MRSFVYAMHHLLILRSPPKAGVSKDARPICRPVPKRCYLLTFQNTGTGAVMMPLTFLRAAIG
jgi:hypothetical protein